MSKVSIAVLRNTRTLGPDNTLDYLEAGSTVSVDSEEADRLIADGVAQKVKGKDKE